MEVVARRQVTGLIGFLALNIVDCVLTAWLLSLGGTEGNWYQLWMGSVPAWAVLTLKMSLAVGIAMLVYRYRSRLFRLLNIGMGIVVAINIYSSIVGYQAYLVGRFG